MDRPMLFIRHSPQWQDNTPPGYKAGETRAPLIRNIAIPLAALAVFLACLRFYVRIFLVRIVGKDDWILLAAVMSLCGLIGSSLWGVSLGIGKHSYDVFLEGDPRRLIPSGVMVQIFYGISQCCVQCSILAFYLRIGLAEIGWRHMRRMIYTLGVFSIVINTGYLILSTVFSTVEAFLVQSQKYLTPLWFTHGSLNLAIDLTIWCMPLPSVISVMHNLSMRKKIGLVLAFAVGMMSWCSAILRIAFRKYIMGLGADPTFYAPIFNVLLISEVSLAISCVSLATLRPLAAKMIKWFNRLRGKPTSTTKGTTSNSKFGASPSPAQSDAYGSRTFGSKPGNKGSFGGQELLEWKDDVLDNEEPQFSQQPFHGPGSDGDVELGSIVAHATSCPRYPESSHISTSAANHDTTRRSLSSLSEETFITTALGSAGPIALPQHPCDRLHSSESTIHLTNGDTDTTPPKYLGSPRPLV